MWSARQTHFLAVRLLKNISYSDMQNSGRNLSSLGSQIMQTVEINANNKNADLVSHHYVCELSNKIFWFHLYSYSLPVHPL